MPAWNWLPCRKTHPAQRSRPSKARCNRSTCFTIAACESKSYHLSLYLHWLHCLMIEHCINTLGLPNCFVKSFHHMFVIRVCVCLYVTLKSWRHLRLQNHELYYFHIRLVILVKVLNFVASTIWHSWTYFASWSCRSCKVQVVPATSGKRSLSCKFTSTGHLRHNHPG